MVTSLKDKIRKSGLKKSFVFDVISKGNEAKYSYKVTKKKM